MGFLTPAYKPDYCNVCRKSVLFQYRTHNDKRIVCLCAECGERYEIGFDVVTIRAFKPKGAIE